MFTLRMLYRRAPWLGKVLMVAVLIIVFLTTIARVHKATQEIQETTA